MSLLPAPGPGRGSLSGPRLGRSPSLLPSAGPPPELLSQLSDLLKAEPGSRSPQMAQAAPRSFYSRDNAPAETQHPPAAPPVPPVRTPSQVRHPTGRGLSVSSSRPAGQGRGTSSGAGEGFVPNSAPKAAVLQPWDVIFYPSKYAPETQTQNLLFYGESGF